MKPWRQDLRRRACARWSSSISKTQQVSAHGVTWQQQQHLARRQLANLLVPLGKRKKNFCSPTCRKSCVYSCCGAELGVCRIPFTVTPFLPMTVSSNTPTAKLSPNLQRHFSVPYLADKPSAPRAKLYAILACCLEMFILSPTITNRVRTAEALLWAVKAASI